jgi:hypothetical protein
MVDRRRMVDVTYIVRIRQVDMNSGINGRHVPPAAGASPEK